MAADPELKYVAQRAFTSYIRSISLQPNKDVFDVTQLPLDAYAEVRRVAVRAVAAVRCAVPCCSVLFGRVLLT